MLLALTSTAVSADTDQNSDLDLIPQAVQQALPNTAPARLSKGRFYIEDAFSRAWSRSGVAMPPPASAGYTWQNRTSFDAIDQWNLAPTLSARLSDRFDVLKESDFDFISSQTVRNELREGYLTWEPATRRYLEAGRINLRNGVALGFNPTDFFRSRSQLPQTSLDPSALRENRLGAAMVHAQSIWNDGSLSLAYAPQLQQPRPLQAPPPSALNPQFDRSNGSSRWLLSMSWHMADLSPQALVFREGNQTRLGLNLSQGIGRSIVAYAEWAAGPQLPLAAEAEAFGKQTGALPADAPLLIGSADRRFRNDLAAGASWTDAAKVTVNLEYHYHQAGFSHGDWQEWFAKEDAQGDVAGTKEALWYLRAYASDRQDPATRQQIFLRVDWADAFLSKLELSTFGIIDTDDGSSLIQASVKYDASARWTVAAYLEEYVGGRHSEFGSLPQSGGVILSVILYF